MAKGGGRVWLFTMGMLPLCLLIQTALVVEGATYAVRDRMGGVFKPTRLAGWLEGIQGQRLSR